MSRTYDDFMEQWCGEELDRIDKAIRDLDASYRSMKDKSTGYARAMRDLALRFQAARVWFTADRMPPVEKP